ncbi:MAG: YsnF/AvaK domain-containing protein [Rhodothermales bacterium]
MTDSSLVVTDVDGREATLASAPVSGSPDRIPLRLDSGERIDIAPDILERRDDGAYHLPVAFSDLLENGGELRVPIVEERLNVSKRVRETGRVRITKHVETRQEVVDEPLLREEVEVERVAVDRYIDAPVPVRSEGDTTIVPVFEEVLVVEKKLLLKEELHITKRRTERRQPQDVTLRSERVEVERLGPEQSPADEPH